MNYLQVVQVLSHTPSGSVFGQHQQISVLWLQSRGRAGVRCHTGNLIPVIRQCQLLAQSCCSRMAIEVCVYDFIKASPKSNALQSRMDAGSVFTTLITQNTCDHKFASCRFLTAFIFKLQLLFIRSSGKSSSSGHSTVTDFARFLGLSTSVPRAQAV